MQFKALLLLAFLMPTLAKASAEAVFATDPSSKNKSAQGVPNSNKAAVTPPSALTVPKQNPQNPQPATLATPSSSKNSINSGSLKVPPQAAVDSGTALQAVPPRAVGEGDPQAIYVPSKHFKKMH